MSGRGQVAQGVAATYLPLIQTYFPPEQVQNALCILSAELAATSTMVGCADPNNCVTVLTIPDPAGGAGTVEAQAYGPFQIVDRYWSPNFDNNSPIEGAEWAAIFDPNVNVWAASIVWSLSGWRAWSTCNECGYTPPCLPGQACSQLRSTLCAVPGGIIPFPRGPSDPTASSVLPLLGAAALLGASVGLAYLAARQPAYAG